MHPDELASPFVNPHGRGSQDSLPNRFEQLSVSWDMDAFEEMRRTDPEFRAANR